MIKKKTYFGYFILLVVCCVIFDFAFGGYTNSQNLLTGKVVSSLFTFLGSIFGILILLETILYVFKVFGYEIPKAFAAHYSGMIEERLDKVETKTEKLEKQNVEEQTQPRQGPAKWFPSIHNTVDKGGQ